jgi:parallel beta helix pectate lyase-like protein
LSDENNFSIQLIRNRISHALQANYSSLLVSQKLKIFFNQNSFIMKTKNFLFVLLVGFLFVGCLKTNENEITFERPEKFEMPFFGNIDYVRPDVPDYFETDIDAATTRSTIKVDPGTNQLQDIINNAAPGTKIKLKAGTHVEDNTLVINHKIELRGEDGAILSLGGAMGILVTDADDVKVKDLTLTNTGTSLLGIGVENSEDFEFKRNDMSGFYISIVLEHAYKANVMESTISGINTTDGLGVVAMNGEKVTVWFNDISGSAFGIWACDKNGKAYNNVLHGNTFGLILCKVPEGSFSPFFSGGTGGSDNPATEWKVKNNVANNNVWGYIAIDGANNNFLSNNEGNDNAHIDLELADETNLLFGFTTPISHNNTVFAGDLDYIDCGMDNTVYQGNDVSADVDCSE